MRLDEVPSEYIKAIGFMIKGMRLVPRGERLKIFEEARARVENIEMVERKENK